MWSTEYSGATTANPEQIWKVLGDPGRWAEWNPGVARIEMGGPFAAGTEAVMVFPDGTELPFRFVWVETNRGFADETPVPDTGVTIRVWHELEPADRGARIVYRIEAEGPDELAAEIGAGVSADFPEVISALAQRAEASN